MKTVIAVLVVLALALGGYLLFREGPGGPGQGGPGGPGGFAVPVEAEKVKRDTVVRAIPAIGTLVSIESVVIRPEIPGRIEEIGFDEGQPVAAGEVMVKLDDAIAQAELAEAEASLALSKANYERAVELFRQKVGSAQARDQALANRRVDEARVAVARARLEKATIRAPFAGIVGLRHVSPGAYVVAGQDIVNLEQIETLKVDFSVPELELSALALGQTVNVTVDAFPGRAFQGKVVAMDPKVDAVSRAIAIRAEIDNPGGVLRPGLFARIALETGRIEGALLVPEEAIVPVGEERFVFRIEDGKAMMTKIKTGSRRPGEVHVTEGLSPGDTVVTAGQIKLRDGAPVQVASPGEAPASPAEDAP